MYPSRYSLRMAQDPHAALKNAEGYEAMRAEDCFLSGFSGDDIALLLDIVGENCCSAGLPSACLVALQRDPPFAKEARAPCAVCCPAPASLAACSLL